MTWLTSPAANEHPGQRLKQLLKKEEILRVPGAHNGLTALIAKEAGFDCLYLSGEHYRQALAYRIWVS